MGLLHAILKSVSHILLAIALLHYDCLNLKITSHGNCNKAEDWRWQHGISFCHTSNAVRSNTLCTYTSCTHQSGPCVTCNCNVSSSVQDMPSSISHASSRFVCKNICLNATIKPNKTTKQTLRQYRSCTRISTTCKWRTADAWCEQVDKVPFDPLTNVTLRLLIQAAPLQARIQVSPYPHVIV